jgi:uncharacterized protein YjbI with pentapeptide repeats/energy-coupling factor transporter ATP-binding protein EcfA2
LSSRTDEHAVEVFPGMAQAIVAGAVLGVIVAVGLGRAYHFAPRALVFGVLLGAFAGALGGICSALSRAAPTPADPATLRDLWDPWLDSREPPPEDDPEPGPSIEDTVELTAGDFHHWRARVRPRVLSSETGESLPLDDMVGPIFAGRESGVIRLVGLRGAGKTTALNHLAGLVPPHLGVSFLDEPHAFAVSQASSRGWVVYTSRDATVPREPVTSLRLAPWGEDEFIEYLLASDQRLCSSVMARLARAKPEHSRLGGNAELWRIVLDRMIADPSVPGPTCALRNEFAAHLPDAERRHLIEADCFAAISDPVRRFGSLRRHHPSEELRRLIRHRPVQILLAADWIARAIKKRAEGDVLAVTLPRDLVLEAASRIAHDVDAVARLGSLITDGDRRIHPMVASLLHALRIGWKPTGPPPALAGAYLEDASWPQIDLAGADMRDADLGGANLWGSRLDRANLEGANLAGANLCGSSLEGATFVRADLSRASLPQVRSQRARFESAHLVTANLIRANFDRAFFLGADLTDARLLEASLVGADLRSTKLEGADFSGADLSEAKLNRLTLVSARFTGTRFTGADLSRCNLEGMRLPGAVFADAELGKALLTGSHMPGADFRGARLRSAGLAEIDWEGADLRGADLREAAFHLGSSRSGLVGSPIASEGSRTGFYTDDWSEQDFKSPEEIRKANLCGADLRGARIDEVDFYLVDLRGALLDPEQVPHIRRCGAILEARA